MALLSVVVPCYNEGSVIPIFYEEASKILKALTNIEYEYIFIDDGSNDNSFKVLKELSEKDSNVKYISFSKNFGKEAAIFAGLSKSNGDMVVIMDADLQDPPALLPEMILSLNEEYDSVATRRVTRKGESKIRSLCARLFYKIINKLSDVDIVDGARDYRLMSRQMVNSVLEIKEYHRFSKGIFGWVGYNTKWLEFENVERIAGETKWSFWKLFKYAIEGIVAFSTAPLRLASLFGVAISGFCTLYILFTIIKTTILGIDIHGYPSTLVIILFLGGVQLIALGIIGEYIAKTYMEVKSRPNYFIKKTNV